VDEADLREHLDAAVGLVGRAGPLALRYFRKALDVENKGGNAYYDPVTRADKEVEDFLRAELGRRFPGYGILGEERGRGGGSASPLRWVIDPIDGTRAFISGMPAWGILLGLQENGDCLVGVMHQPFTRETFFAARGQGAALRRDSGTVAIETRAVARLSDAVLYSTHPEMFAEEYAAAAYRRVASAVRLTRFGGDCYSYCLLAMGQIDLVIENGLQPYDIVPLIPIIEEAGGKVSNEQGETACEGGFVIAAASEQLHAQALELVAQCGR